jgi:hypothetical protein
MSWHPLDQVVGGGGGHAISVAEPSRRPSPNIRIPCVAQTVVSLRQCQPVPTAVAAAGF